MFPRLRSVQRLSAAFLGILGLFAIALFVVLHSLGEMAAASQEAARLEQAKQAGHRVAVLIREQYIHQAHTIIEWNESHLEHYRDVARRARSAADELEKFTSNAAQVELAREISVLVRRNDTDFESLTLTAMRAGDQARVRRLHVEMDAVVGHAARTTNELTATFAAQSDAASRRAADMRARTRMTAIACFALAAAFAALVALWATRNVGRRLSTVLDGVSRLGGGDLGARVEVSGHDEFTVLAGKVNEMAQALEEREDQLVSAQRLAAIGQVAAGVAHEINNPLGVILGYAKTMRRAGAGGDDEGLRIIEEEALECQRTVEALLDLGRPQRHTATTIDLAWLVHDVVERLLATRVLQQEPSERYDTDGRVCMRGDEVKIRQVVRNLLMNAAEASMPEGHIDIELRREEQRVVLIVQDRGPGMAPAECERVYEPFFTTKDKGMGLGLTIVRAIVEAHHGEIRIESKPGEGTRVVVGMPAVSR